MNARPKWEVLTGRDAEIATLRAKLDIARLRGEQVAAEQYAARLRELEQVAGGAV